MFNACRFIMCFSPKSHGQKWLITLNTYFLYSSGYTPVCGLLATTQVYGSWSLRQLLLFTRIPLQVSHYRLFQRTANFFTKPKPCYITILKHTSLFVVAAAERHRNVLQYGRRYRTRTCACRNQNPMPYQLGESPSDHSKAYSVS